MTTNKSWKITNVSKQQIKISVATGSSTAPGVILQPGEYCISNPQLTAPIDAQRRRKFIEIDTDYENKFNLPLATAFNKDELELAKEQTEKYTG